MSWTSLSEAARQGPAPQGGRPQSLPLTDQGYRTTLYLSKLHQRLLAPTLDTLDAAARPTVLASPHPLDRALADLNTSFDHLAELSGLKVAA